MPDWDGEFPKPSYDLYSTLKVYQVADIHDRAVSQPVLRDPRSPNALLH